MPAQFRATPNKHHWDPPFLVIFKKNKVTPFSRVSSFWNKKELESCHSCVCAAKGETGPFKSWWTQPSLGDKIQEVLWCDGNRLSWDAAWDQSLSSAPHTCRSHSQQLQARSHGRSCLTTQKCISQMELKPSHHHRAPAVSLFSKCAGSFWPLWF